MWLPKEERYLLMFYTAYDPNFDQSTMTFEIEDLKRVLSKNVRPSQFVKLASELRERERGAGRKDNDVENTQAGGDKKTVMTETHDNVNGVKRYMSWLRAKVTIESVNNRLKERGLIESRECGTGFYQVEMNLTGWDLGNKYSSGWSRNVLWFREYKDHWIWLIVSFFGGVIGALLINWVSSLFTNSTGAQ